MIWTTVGYTIWVASVDGHKIATVERYPPGDTQQFLVKTVEGAILTAEKNVERAKQYVELNFA
jgi:hypothetical protein